MLIQRMEQDLTSLQTAFGEADMSYFDLSVFNLHALLIVNRTCRTRTRSMREPTSVLMNNVYEKVSKDPSLLSFLTCGMGHIANICIKKLASMLAAKWDHPFNSTPMHHSAHSAGGPTHKEAGPDKEAAISLLRMYPIIS